MKRINKILFLILLSKSSLFCQDFISVKINENIFSNHTTDTIHLPFWDDFSKNKIDDNYWSFYDDISIRNYNNNNAPSLNVIELDGLDADGNPYNEIYGQGVSDIIISDIINLKDKKDEDSIFMSFFWNYNINGEFPDYEDSIKLEFLNKNNNWDLVWSKIGGSENFHGNYFKYEILNIKEKYLHNNFKFKFSNIGNSEGPFDSWVLDYIYINSNRNEDDSTFLDRTLSYSPSRLFKEYFSIPIKHFDKANNIVDSLEITINNLDENIQPINYSYLVSTDNPYSSTFIEEKKQLSPILNGFESRKIKTKNIDLMNIDVESDSLNINLKFFITSGDSIYANTNYLNNDTSSYDISFSNYYSYDDGTPEFAAGLNQKNAELIVEFKTLKKDTLTHLALIFPNTNNEYSGNINLIGYKDYNDEKLFNQTEFISYDNKKLNLFKLKNPVLVEDTFYVGFKQNNNNFLPVGLDKNTNSSNKIFYKVDGMWNQNTVINGSLIIRPVFGKTNYVLTSINEIEIERGLNIYPNPSNGKFYLSEAADIIFILNSEGKKIMNLKSTNEINLENYPKGNYIIIIQKNSFVITKKIILN